MYAPEAELSQANRARLDGRLSDILNSGPEFTVFAAADHGMRAKSRALDLGQMLAEHKVAGEAVPIIKDRYVAHHQNLGGAAYIFLDDMHQLTEASLILRGEAGVESVWTREEASYRFQLMPERIGDLFVLASEESVFGSLPTAREAVDIRSHGCLHTRAVPIIAAGPGIPREPFAFNYDAANWIKWE
jgi:phosphonoacetate hydrolase